MLFACRNRRRRVFEASKRPPLKADILTANFLRKSGFAKFLGVWGAFPLSLSL